MEALQVNPLQVSIHKIEKIIDRKKTVNPFHSETYTEILLYEYKNLVELLTQLDESGFRAIYAEVNKVLNELGYWFNENSSGKSFETYWAIRHLKQKVRKQIRKTQMSQQHTLRNGFSTISYLKNR